MTNEKINQLTTAIGAIAELTMDAYKKFLAVGFSDSQAFTLAQSLMNSWTHNPNNS